MKKSRGKDLAETAPDRTNNGIAALGEDAKLHLDVAKTQFEDLTSQVTTTAGQVYGQARDRMRGAAEVVATSVERQPFVSLVVAGLVGSTVGFLLARR
jgi:ElaB/YqjD/DUF883 family membrane-anchored ribosome-binding protein